jgi:hypothetical protein
MEGYQVDISTGEGQSRESTNRRIHKCEKNKKNHMEEESNSH